MKLDDTYLRSVCTPVDFTNPKKNLKLAHDLIKLMIKERGIGLAANQCGINMRVFVMRIRDRYFHCFNPSILESSDTMIDYNEGCLSFSGQYCNISRPCSILVEYYSSSGDKTVERLDGLAARCFQHELDHLNGITMLDR